VLTLSAETGGSYGDGDDGSRLITPDLELHLALSKRVQLAVEGGLTVTQVGSDQREVAGDPLWLSVTATLISMENEETGAIFGAGVQVGPRLPSVGAADALGGAALLLVGGGTRRLQVVANVGGVVDRSQTAALLFGLDVQLELGKAGDWELLADVGGLYAIDGDPAQLLVAVGAGWEVTDALELSLLVLGGPVFEGDRIGALVGLRQDFGLW